MQLVGTSSTTGNYWGSFYSVGLLAGSLASSDGFQVKRRRVECRLSHCVSQWRGSCNAACLSRYHTCGGMLSRPRISQSLQRYGSSTGSMVLSVVGLGGVLVGYHITSGSARGSRNRPDQGLPGEILGETCLGEWIARAWVRFLLQVLRPKKKKI